MSKLMPIGILLALGLLLACSSPADEANSAATPAEPAIRAVQPTPTAAPTATLVPLRRSTPTPVPNPTPTRAAAATPTRPDTDTGVLAPFTAEDPRAFLSELSPTEQSCVSDSITHERLDALLKSLESDSAPPSPEEAAFLLQCLEQEAQLRLFLTGLFQQTGPLSVETSDCIRGGLAALDVEAILLSGVGESADEAALVGGMASFLVMLSCLNEEEWQAASPGLEMRPEDREGIHCLLEKLGGPEGVAAALQPTGEGPPVAFFSAAMECQLQMMPEPAP